jgi:hypothetical protein
LPGRAALAPTHSCVAIQIQTAWTFAYIGSPLHSVPFAVTEPPATSSRVTSCKANANAAYTTPVARAAVDCIAFLTFEIISSIGASPGHHGGSGTTRAPRTSTASVPGDHVAGAQPPHQHLLHARPTRDTRRPPGWAKVALRAPRSQGATGMGATRRSGPRLDNGLSAPHTIATSSSRSDRPLKGKSDSPPSPCVRVSLRVMRFAFSFSLPGQKDSRLGVGRRGCRRSDDDGREDIRHAGGVPDRLLLHPGISTLHLGLSLGSPE